MDREGVDLKAAAKQYVQSTGMFLEVAQNLAQVLPSMSY